jgi:hypothetical protein
MRDAVVTLDAAFECIVGEKGFHGATGVAVIDPPIDRLLISR